MAQKLLFLCYRRLRTPGALYVEGRKRPSVELAVPYAVGDNYYGYRIVGTTEEMFTKFEYQAGRKFEISPPGKLFNVTRREAVVGSFVAEKMGLTIGSIINPYHGLTFVRESKHPEEYHIAGIMKPTNSPADRVIWIPIEGIFRMEGHVLRGAGKTFVAQAGQAIPDEHKEVSTVMLKLKSPQAGFMLDSEVNKQGKVATLAWPICSALSQCCWSWP